MDKQIHNTNITSETVITSPDDLSRQLPITEKAKRNIMASRKVVNDILSGKDSRFMVIVGPCSIHDTEATFYYAERAKELDAKVSDRFLIIIRTYFEKPRTSLGWEGLIIDSNMDGSDDVNKGYHLSRKILLRISELGLPCATEYLESFTPQYNSDLISWAAIGARTAYSPQHRKMASGLSMPVGIKNDTHGDVSIAVNAILAAQIGRPFLGINEYGTSSIAKTSGNTDTHLVLRGGDTGPNYDKASVERAQEMLKSKNLLPNIVVDCSHDNTMDGEGKKDYKKQIDVFQDTIKQVKDGNRGIVGLMLESNLKAGNQKIPSDLRGFDRSTLEYGLSVTDPCLDLETTIDLIMDAYRTLSKTSAQVTK